MSFTPKSKFWIPVVLALVLAPVAGILATIAYGVAHPAADPPYFPKYCFPFTFLLAAVGGHAGGLVELVFPGIQVALYGVTIGWCWSRHSSRPLLLLLTVQLLATVLLFLICPGRKLCG